MEQWSVRVTRRRIAESLARTDQSSENCCRVRCPQRINSVVAQVGCAEDSARYSYSAFAACVRFIEMDLLTLTDIRRAASRTSGSAVPARVHVQVESAAAKTQREGKPYC